MCGDGGPIVFVFSSAFDDSNTALESLRALSVSLSVSLWWRVNTGPGFIFCFSFRMRTRGTFHPCSLHSQNLSTTPNPYKILITFDWKPRVCPYAFFAWMTLYYGYWVQCLVTDQLNLKVMDHANSDTYTNPGQSFPVQKRIIQW